MAVTEFDEGVNPELIAQQQHAAAVQQDFSQYAKYLNAPDASTRDVIRDERKRFEGEDMRLVNELIGEEGTRYGKYLHETHGAEILALVDKIKAKGTRFEKDDPDLIALEKKLHDPKFLSDLQRFKGAKEAQDRYNKLIDEGKGGRFYHHYDPQQDDYRINPETGEVEFATGMQRQGKDGKMENVYTRNISGPEIIKETLVGDEADNPIIQQLNKIKQQEGGVTAERVADIYQKTLDKYNAATYSKMAYEALADNDQVPDNIKQMLDMYWNAGQRDPSVFKEMKQFIKQVVPKWYANDLNVQTSTFHQTPKPKEDHSVHVNVNLNPYGKSNNISDLDRYNQAQFAAIEQAKANGSKFYQSPAPEMEQKVYFGKEVKFDSKKSWTHPTNEFFESKKRGKLVTGPGNEKDRKYLLDVWNRSQRIVDKDAEYETNTGSRLTRGVIKASSIPKEMLERLKRNGTVSSMGKGAQGGRGKEEEYVRFKVHIEPMTKNEATNMIKDLSVNKENKSSAWDQYN